MRLHQIATAAETPPPSDTSADVGLSTGAVALRLGVAPATLRSWERRYAIGPTAERVTGKHRRWLPQDIARLEEMCRLTSRGVPPAEAARAARLAGTQTVSRTLPAETDSQPRTPGGRDVLPLGQARTEARGLARAAVRFGPAVPADAPGEAVPRVGPSVVVVWAQSRSTATPDVLSTVKEIEWGLMGARSRPRLLLAGPGWSILPDTGSRQLTGLRSGHAWIESLLSKWKSTDAA